MSHSPPPRSPPPQSSRPQSPPRWKRKNKMIKATDPIMKDPRPTDFIIPVMGPTGAGKSTFINKLLGEDTVEVGHMLQSCTAQLKPIVVDAESYPHLFTQMDIGRLVIVDTPGFDDTYVDDSEILRRISIWLAASYSDSMQLGGMIYMHEISQVRMFGTTRTNTEVFKKLCGTDNMLSVVLVTTKWDDVVGDQGRKREKELAEKYWKDMLDDHARQVPFLNNEKSARAIIDLILERCANRQGYKPDQQVIALQIQKELVNLQKIIPDTDAAKSLKSSLEEALENHRKMVDKMKRNHPDGGGYKEVQDQINKILQQLGELKVNFPRRLLAAFGGT